MKIAVVLSVICLAAVASARKADRITEENVDSEWSSIMENTEQHQAKKYAKDSKHSHHHHHSKHQKPLDSSERKQNGRMESKKTKHIPKNAPPEVPQQEAELQADLHASKKHLKDQHIKDAQQDLHLQDLTFEENLKKSEKDAMSPNQYQRGHHKTSHHVMEDKVLNADQGLPEVERKLFAEQSSKKHHKPSHSIIEDTFEPLGQQQESFETKKHGKKSNKNKKPVEKVKKGKKGKNPKKDKENKKERKQKKW